MPKELIHREFGILSPLIEGELSLLDSDTRSNGEIVAQYNKSFEEERERYSSIFLLMGFSLSSVIQLAYLMNSQTSSAVAVIHAWDLAEALMFHGAIGILSAFVAGLADFLVKSRRSAKLRSLNNAILGFCKENPHLAPETMGAYSIFLKSDKNILGMKSSYDDFIISGCADESSI